MAYIYRERETLFIEEAYLAYFTTLIYHKVLVNNKIEHHTDMTRDPECQLQLHSIIKY